MYRILRNPCSKQLARQALQTVNTQPKRAYWPVRYDPFEGMAILFQNYFYIEKIVLL